MVKLMRKDLANLREIQAWEHTKMLVALTICQELEAHNSKLARAHETHFFNPPIS